MQIPYGEVLIINPKQTNMKQATLKTTVVYTHGIALGLLFWQTETNIMNICLVVIASLCFIVKDRIFKN